MSKSRYADSHANPDGPGDARPTAKAIVEDEGLVGKLSNKVILITGSSSGIGLESARALSLTGAHIFITVRDDSKGASAKKELEASRDASHGKIDVLKLEVDSLQSVRECAADFLNKSKQLNVLITNAGVMACPEGRTRDGFDTQFGTNHLGHFLLFEILKSTLLASSTSEFQSRVVTLSSVAHIYSSVNLDDLDLKKSGYDPWKAYGQSKTANIYMATEIERRYGEKGLHGFAVHPGGIFTPLFRHLSEEQAEQFRQPEVMRFMKSPEQGAATTVMAAISKGLEGKGGKYLENCDLSVPRAEGETDLMQPGYMSYIYDEVAASKLWEISLKLVGLDETS